MTDLITTQKHLPATLDDLAPFILIGMDKLQVVRAEINAINKLGLACEVREQKLPTFKKLAPLYFWLKRNAANFCFINLVDKTSYKKST